MLYYVKVVPLKYIYQKFNTNEYPISVYGWMKTTLITIVRKRMNFNLVVLYWILLDGELSNQQFMDKAKVSDEF